MFQTRSNEKEFLDDFDVKGEDLEQNLKELKFINKWLGGNQTTFTGLNKALSKNPKGDTLHIADLGCGGGDILTLLHHWALKNKFNVALTGVDANTSIIDYAKKNTSQYKNISYLPLNVFSEAFASKKYDLVNCTLFCHHLDDAQLIQLFSQLKKQVSIAVVINDLHRQPFAYYSIKWLTYFFSKSFMVKNDAKLSVLRGFRKNELESIILKAGFDQYSIRWRWAFRWEVVLWN